MICWQDFFNLKIAAVACLAICFGAIDSAHARIFELALCAPVDEGTPPASSCGGVGNSAFAERSTGTLKASAFGTQEADAEFIDELVLNPLGQNVTTHVMHVHGSISGDSHGDTALEVFLTLNDLGTGYPIAAGYVKVHWDGLAVSIDQASGVGSVTNISLVPDNVTFDLSVSV